MTTNIDGIDIHAHAVPKLFLEEVKRTRLGGVDVTAADKGGYIVTFPGCALPLPAAARSTRRWLHRNSSLPAFADARRGVVRETAESLFRTTRGKA